METQIEIQIDGIQLKGILTIPKNAQAIVLFAHGSGSSRLSPRNTFVAKALQDAHLATLLIDLLSPDEDADYRMRFDISLLTKRLKEITEWLSSQPETSTLKIGLFGASTGAAAALETAADLSSAVDAVVSRGGRPDLAIACLPRVKAPTLLIVGERDFDVLQLNQLAYQALVCKKEFVTVENATHLFEEPGCLLEVANLAKAWFLKYLRKKEEPL